MTAPQRSFGTIDLHVVAYTSKQERERSILPKCFIEGLRSALEAGMTSEQIASSLMIMAGIHDMRDMDPTELVGRTKEVLATIRRYDDYVEQIDCLED